MLFLFVKLTRSGSSVGHLHHCLYKLKKSSESKVKFRQVSNFCKSVLEAAKLACTKESKEPITSQKLSSWAFC